ncbi:MAG: monovalent cation/H(+) antiporter subunit G [Verrucomicrobia bacterium]|nr:monovalent cation/H(+) antiporter subunit G [Verrucomicrobiota bacterium]
MTDLLASWLLLFGAAFILIAAVGAVRLPDVLCRSHAVAKASTLGIFSMLLGLWLELGTEAVGLKIILAILFQVTTIPAAGHLVSLLAKQKDLPRWRPAPRQAPPPTSGPSRPA